MKRKNLSDEEKRALRFIKAMGGLQEVMRGFQKGMTYESDLAEIMYGDPYKKVDERQAISEVFNRLETEEKRSKFFNGWGGFDKFVRFFEGILGRYAEDAKTLDELFDAIEQATLPQGCEWPKDRNGKSIKPNYPVNIYGEKMRIVAISHKDRLCIRPWEKANGGGGFWVKSSEVSLSPCGQETGAEKKVLDADGNRVHIGDTVYATSDDATEFTVSGFRGGKVIVKRAGHASEEIYPWFITRHPFVLAADGKPLKVGQTVWNINNGMEFNVSRLPKPGEYQAVEVRHRNGSSTSFDPCRLTHQRPVLDADGVPIKKGDTVYLLPGKWCDVFPCCGFHGGEELEVRETCTTRHKSGGILCWSRHDHSMICYPQPSHLTHTKPEPPDSWERIEEDAGKDRCSYFGAKYQDCGRCTQLATSCSISKASDLVRRCKALAERGER